MTPLSGKRILITGGYGFIGTNLFTELERRSIDVSRFNSSNFDLTSPDDVKECFDHYNPDILIHLAADVGGYSYMEKYKEKIFYNNLLIDANVIHNAYENNVDKVVSLGSILSYGSDQLAPYKTKYLDMGLPNKGSMYYGYVKQILINHTSIINSLNSINLILDNTYGPNDTFEIGKSRVIPTNIIRFIEIMKTNNAQQVIDLFGNPIRDYLYVSDAVDAVILAAEKQDVTGNFNIGNGNPISLSDLIRKISYACGYDGELLFDSEETSEDNLRYLDTEITQEVLGWSAKVDIDMGIKETIRWYRDNLC